MSPSAFEAAESQWLSQLMAMREALSQIKVPSPQENGQMKGYGHDIELEDDDTSGPSLSDEPWEFDSDNDHSLSTEINVPVENSSSPDGNSRAEEYGPEWLRRKCVDFVSRNSGLSVEDLHGQLIAFLGSDSDGKSTPIAG